MINHVDLLVVGAGPAGLSAANAASSCGLDVALFDEQCAAGGQIFRNLHLPYGKEILDTHERELGLKLLEDFHASSVQYFSQTNVWGMENNTVFCQHNGKSEKVTASKILYATGAMERPVPFKGWTLPGVMTVGAAEVILRSGGEIPHTDGVVLAGNGPLLLSLAVHLLERNIPIKAWLDTGLLTKKIDSIVHMPRAFQDMPYMSHGMKMALKILKSKIHIIPFVKEIEAYGEDNLQKIRYRRKDKWEEIETTTLLRHENIIPRIQIPSALGLDLEWDSVQRYWHPKLDAFGRSSMNNVYMTGDAGFVDGGEAAMAKGYVTGIAIAEDLGVISKDEANSRGFQAFQKMKKITKARNYLRHIFAANPEVYKVADDVTVCRCECVTAGDIRKAVREGYHTPDEVKRFTRSGMGACQARMCGNAMIEIIAQELGTEAHYLGLMRNRQPFHPVSLASYVNLCAPKAF